LLGHLWGEVGRSGDRADDVDGPGSELLPGCQVADRVTLNHRRVVDEQLRDAEAIDNLVERGAQPRLVGHVRGHAQRVVVRQHRERTVDRRLGAGDQSDREAGACDAARDSGPDPRAGPDDDCS
jgi:hypothetical protein